MTPEQRARFNIGVLLQQAGWHVWDVAHADIDGTGVQIRSTRYAQDLPSALLAWVLPLPFSNGSTAIETKKNGENKCH